MDVRYRDIERREGYSQCGSTPERELRKGISEGE
jgi:hypothetical protein